MSLPPLHQNVPPSLAGFIRQGLVRQGLEKEKTDGQRLFELIREQMSPIMTATWGVLSDRERAGYEEAARKFLGKKDKSKSLLTPDKEDPTGIGFCLWGFGNKNVRDAYKSAIETMIDLRRQPGTVPATEGGDVQFTINVYHDSNERLWVTHTAHVNCKIGQICPMFESEISARKAIEAVGADRILSMFKTLHHVGGDA